MNVKEMLRGAEGDSFRVLLQLSAFRLPLLADYKKDMGLQGKS